MDPLIKSPSFLTRLFPLYDRQYILHDQEGNIWYFEERLSNGMYAKYTLSGKTIGKGFSGSANLFAKFICTENEVSVFIEDVITTKKDMQVGTWLINRLIELLRLSERAVKVRRVYGHLKRDEDLAHREAFFSKFGFNVKKDPHERLIITAELEDLHMLPLREAKEVPLLQVITEWSELSLKR